MMFNTGDKTNYFLYDTDIENLFIGEYMLDANGDYVKVYLLALMYAKSGVVSDNSVLAKQLSMSLASVEKAWEYWAQAGLVTLSDGKVTFVNLKEVVFGQCASSVSTAYQGSGNERIQNLNSQELAKLLRDVEQTTGRLLEAKEPEMIAAWASDFGIPSDVILFCYKYCTEKGNSNRAKYVEKILLDWREKGFTSAAMVEEYLSENDKQYETYKKIFKYLGFRRNPSEPDKAMMRKWINEYGFGLDKILEACKKTTGVSNLSLNYIDKILSAWHAEETGGNASGSSDKYMKIQSLYETIRKENERKTQERRQEIYTNVPRIGEIMGEIKSASYKVVSAMLSADKNLQEKAEQQRRELEKEKEELLVQNGYDKNALDPIYSCPKCKDTGYIDDQSVCSCYAEMLKLS